MKKLFLTLLCAATLTLTGCEQSMSSGQLKSNLESKGYIVEVMNPTEAKARIKGINYNVDITDAVYTKKGTEDVFVAFVCKNMDDADKFIKENIAAMTHYAEEYTENPKVGFHNNVAYTGSARAATDAGIPNLL